MHKAVKKGPVQSPCTIFFFDKKDLRDNKQSITEISEFLKLDASNLAKMKHPNVL